MENKFKFDNSPESIDEISEKVKKFILKSGLTNKEAISYCLSIENCLIEWNHNLNNSYFILYMGKTFGQYYISLETDGKAFNPYIPSSNNDDISKTIFKSLGIYPEFDYKDGINTLTFIYLKRPKGKLLKILIGILSGAVISALCKFLLTDEINEFLLNGYILPLYSTFFRMLNCISGPLVCLSMLWGIYGIGDTITFSKTGKNIIVPFLLFLLLIAVVGSGSFFIFNSLSSNADTNLSQLSKIFEMILNVVPSNIIQPFSDGNTLQIIFISVIMGLAILFLGKRVAFVSELVEQINLLVTYCMGLISDIIPGFIGLVIIKIILSNSLSLISSIWVFFVSFIGLVIVLCFTVTLITSINNDVKMSVLVKKSIPTFLISITTASSAAAFESNVTTCIDKFGISKSLTSFSIPLGMVMFKSSTVLYYMFMSFYFASIYGIECSLTWIATCILTSVLLSVATPPIPGGGAAAYAVLMSQMGLPNEALALALSIDIIFDFIRTSANMYNLPLTIINRAKKLGQLDNKILRKNA